MQEDPELVSTSAAARAVGVGRSTLWRWIKLGHVVPHARTAGGHLRWNIPRLRREVGAIRNEYTQELRMPDPATTPEHPSVVAAIVTSHRGVLAGRRNDGKPPWTFIAGKIEAGESQVDAAIREVKEETGLEVRAGHNEIGRRLHPKTNKLMIYLACFPVAGTDAFVGDPEELAEVRWLSLNEVDELMPDMFQPVREHLGRVIV